MDVLVYVKYIWWIVEYWSNSIVVLIQEKQKFMYVNMYLCMLELIYVCLGIDRWMV